MYFVKLRVIPRRSAREPRAHIAACFVNTRSAMVAMERARTRLGSGDWDAREVLEIRRVRRSSCMEDPAFLEQYDLAETAGIAVRLYTWTFQRPGAGVEHGKRAV
jgi:hypothetical protein